MRRDADAEASPGPRTRASFPDHFSEHAEEYEAYRPTYPAGLFEYLAGLAPGRRTAWDCATGNGQAAIDLAPHFQSVVATDASPAQLARAARRPNVDYIVAVAERSPLADRSVDLVTVALALHWLDHDRFSAEVRRVARPGGVLACWTYHLQTVDPEVDAVTRRLESEVLKPYWTSRHRYVQDGYRSIDLPLREVQPPPFRIVRTWDLERLVGYIGTWSSSLAYRKANGRSVVEAVRPELTAAWGDPGVSREVAWDLHLRVGEVVG